MKDAQLIYRWQLCQKHAADLGMTLETNSENLIAQGKSSPTSFKGFYCADTVNAMLGFLEGVKEVERVRKHKPE